MHGPARAAGVLRRPSTARRGWAWLERGSRENVAATVGNIHAPTLVVAGAADPVIPHVLLERDVVRQAPRACMTALADLGHLVPIEAPVATAVLIRAHRDLR